MQSLMILYLALLPLLVASFNHRYRSSRRSRHYASITTTTTDEDLLTPKGLFKRDCYIATNRFSVRSSQNAKFEQRWATRKSRLAELDGFRFFQLMRRVDTNGNYIEGTDDASAFENYVSFTIWDKKSHFSAWRKGPAFAEAHGGTGIVSFLSTMVNSAMVLRGAPRPAFYDGINTQVTVVDAPATVDGWRQVVSDGVHTLDAESMCRFTKFYCEDAAAFEQQYTEQKQHSSNSMVRALLRRDGQAQGHGITPMDATEPNYVEVCIVKDPESLEPAFELDGVRSETSYYQGTLVMGRPYKEEEMSK